MNGAYFYVFNIPFLIDCLAKNIEDPSHKLFAHGNLKRLACVNYLRTSGETLGGRQGDPPDSIVVELSKYLDDYLSLIAGLENIADRRRRRKVDINNAAADG